MSNNFLSKSTRIAELNDEFRKTGPGGKTVMTRAVADLPVEVISRAVVIVQTFNDFFSFEVVGEKFFWKCNPVQNIRQR